MLWSWSCTETAGEFSCQAERTSRDSAGLTPVLPRDEADGAIAVSGAGTVCREVAAGPACSDRAGSSLVMRWVGNADRLPTSRRRASSGEGIRAAQDHTVR